MREVWDTDRKRALVDKALENGATINGNRAIVSGYLNDYARVTDATSGLSCEFAWPTVERILSKGGEFKS